MNYNSTLELTNRRVYDDRKADWQAPEFVAPMLRNTHLYYDEKTHRLTQTGDFWYWKLTNYGLDLMRILVHASENGFSYAETFIEPGIENIPQLVLLTQLNSIIQDEQIPEWNLIRESSYLLNKNAVIDFELLQWEIEELVEHIKQGTYSQSGYKVFKSHHF